MDFKKLVEEARSCRRFVEEQRIGQEEVQALIDIARIAPCARNAQVLRYVAAHSKEACDAIFPHTRWAGALKWDGPIDGERPTAYIAILAPKNATKLVHMDVGIAAQTIQLAAQSKGYGACMHASFSPNDCIAVFGGIPEDMDMLLVLGIGVQKEERHIAPMPADGSFMYWRNEKAVHFVPKRSLNEVLLKLI